MQPNPRLEPEQEGAAERLLKVVLGSGEHLWHNRPGIDVDDTWYPALKRRPRQGAPVRPGLFVPAAVRLYRQLLQIHEIDEELMAHFASFALLESDWRDLKVASAALMLVQPRSGQPVRDDDGSVAFLDDDYREIGEAMILWYRQGSDRMMSPKMVLRVGEFLQIPEIAALNRQAGFADPAGRKPPLGRWPKAAREWLALRERNLPLMEGLVAAGYKETIKRLARKVGYRPTSPRFFELLGWPQTQAEGGHRTVGLEGLDLHKRERFDGLDERAICERIVAERLTYKETVGRLPADVPLTPAIMAALLPSLSDRDLRIMTPTLESLGLLTDPEVRGRWERAVQAATDQRALNIAKNVRNRDIRRTLEEGADAAARAAVAESIAEVDLYVMFLIDRSGSMEGAIDASKRALTNILAGFPPERVSIATFNTMGQELKLKAPTRTAVDHALKRVKATGGTAYSSALTAFQRAHFEVPAGSKLVFVAVGDENGEEGRYFAQVARVTGYIPDAIALIVAVDERFGRGRTLRDASRELRVPFSEVSVDAFDDPYQVTRVLRALLDAPVAPGTGLLERVLATPLLEKPA